MANTSTFIPAGVSIVTDASLTGNGTLGSPLSVVPGQIDAPGADTQVIFNEGGIFGADAGLTYNKTTDTLLVKTTASPAVTPSTPFSLLVLDDASTNYPIGLLNPTYSTDIEDALQIAQYNDGRVFFTVGFGSEGPTGIALLFNPATGAVSVPNGSFSAPNGITAQSITTFQQFTADAPDVSRAGIFDALYTGGNTGPVYAYGGVLQAAATAGTYQGTVSGGLANGIIDNVTAASVYGIALQATASGTATTTRLAAAYLVPFVSGATASVTHGFGAYVDPVKNNVGSTLTDFSSFYSADLASMGTNPYYFWGDSRGVFAVKEEFTQAVPRLYNPVFTKYVPGAADYERWITRYGLTGSYGTSNILYMGGEAGGTGTLRLTSLLGAGVQLESVPGTSTFLQMAEMTAPAAPAANGVRIFAVDSGGGKTVLKAIFASGAAQVLATEP